jgi:hypothetical protein
MQKEDLPIDITLTPVSFRWTIPLKLKKKYQRFNAKGRPFD